MKKSILLAVLVSATALVACAKKSTPAESAKAPGKVEAKATPSIDGVTYLGACESTGVGPYVDSAQSFVSFSTNGLGTKIMTVGSNSYSGVNDCKGDKEKMEMNVKRVAYKLASDTLGTESQVLMQTFKLASEPGVNGGPAPSIAGDMLENYWVTFKGDSMTISGSANGLIAKDAVYTK